MQSPAPSSPLSTRSQHGGTGRRRLCAVQLAFESPPPSLPFDSAVSPQRGGCLCCGRWEGETPWRRRRLQLVCCQAKRLAWHRAPVGHGLPACCIKVTLPRCASLLLRFPLHLRQEEEEEGAALPPRVTEACRLQPITPPPLPSPSPTHLHLPVLRHCATRLLHGRFRAGRCTVAVKAVKTLPSICPPACCVATLALPAPMQAPLRSPQRCFSP